MENKVNMHITHEEARRLLQFDFDEGLKIEQKQMLDVHLASCMECKKYAENTKKMESVLRPLLQRQWNQQPIPLSIDQLVSNGNSKIFDGLLLATRIAAVGVMFVVFVFSAWQFALSKPNLTDPMHASVPPIPIPSTSTQSISTKTQTRTCEETMYVVQENDTLASIAGKFLTSKEDIMKANNMKKEVLTTGTKLRIPLCNFTPTGTVNTLTTTFTPILRTITSTPGG